jgi:hypothetical protein
MSFRASVVFLLLASMSMAACQKRSQDKDDVPVTVSGVDHLLPDYLTVQRFTINGEDMGRAGGGGSSVCCVTLPRKWHPDMTVKVAWNVTNWRDCKGQDYEATVPIEKYSEPGYVFVHFLPGGQVRIFSSELDGPESPRYQGPHAPIPDKHPWDEYPPHVHCESNFQR